MTWNHRIVVTIDELGNEFFELAEVFYDSYGKPYAYGQATISADNIKDINKQLYWFMEAGGKDVLKYPEHFTGDVNE
jgi:hypothetical protein